MDSRPLPKPWTPFSLPSLNASQPYHECLIASPAIRNVCRDRVFLLKHRVLDDDGSFGGRRVVVFARGD